MLYLENEEIKITEEGMQLSEVQDVYKDDKHSGKPYFKKVITYLYWAHKKDGEWQNHFPSKREEMSAEKAGLSIIEIRKHSKLKALIKAYVDNQTTLTERLYIGVKRDIEEVLELINSIPYVRKIQVELTVDIPKFEGSSGLIKYPVKQIVEVDNSKEKTEAIKRVESLIELEERLRKKIIKDAQISKTKNGRMFDKR